ncbi:MAG: HAMP domain-containing histidine kinase [Myxococcales bacterium]|nr:HAMP domain-containing histidine kinase [Myxococcales bacterium]
MSHKPSTALERAWNPSVEARFSVEAAERSARGMAVVTVAACTLALLWAVGDFRYFPEVATRFLYVRVAVVVWCVSTALVAVKARDTRLGYAAMWLWFLAWGANSAFMIPHTPNHLLSHVFVIVIAQVGSAGFVIWTWRSALTMSLALLAIGEMGLVQVPGGGYEIFAAHAYLATGAVLSVVFTALKYQAAREQFQQRLELAAQKAKTESLLTEVTQMREDRLVWLENLARFLRHEIKNQVIAVSTSLDLLEHKPGHARDRYIGRARQSLGRMNRLVTDATEATSLETALAAEHKELVDLSEVVGERVILFRQANSDRAFHADIESQIQLDGSQDRLAQLLDKLLDNAVEHTPEGGDIHVSLRRLGSQVVLGVENRGDPLPEMRERLFHAFVRAGENEHNKQNLGLGLFVAKVIARAHSADIVATDNPELPGARFEVRFRASCLH